MSNASTVYHITCTGKNITTAPVPHCNGGWELVPVVEQFNLEQLDPTQLAQLFSVGFGLVATVLMIGIGIRAVLSFIRSA